MNSKPLLIQRRPGARYVGRDGFKESPSTFSQQQEVHEHAFNVLKFYSVPPPSVDEILSKDWSQPGTETSTVVNERIEDLEKRYSKAMAQLCDSTVAAYHTDRHYRNVSFNEVLDLEPTHRKKSVKEARGTWASDTVFTTAEERGLSLAKSQQRIIQNKRVPYPLPSNGARNSLRTLPTVSRLRHSYLKRVIPMRQYRDQLRKQEKDDEEQREYNMKRQEEEKKRREEEERKRITAQFPRSLEEFAQKEVEFQRRIARFLCSGEMYGHRPSDSGLSPVQDKMLKDWKLSVEEVTPLRQIFVKDPTFAARMQALNISSQTATKDPRTARN